MKFEPEDFKELRKIDGAINIYNTMAASAANVKLREWLESKLAKAKKLRKDGDLTEPLTYLVIGEIGSLERWIEEL